MINKLRVNDSICVCFIVINNIDLLVCEGRHYLVVKTNEFFIGINCKIKVLFLIVINK